HLDDAHLLLRIDFLATVGIVLHRKPADVGHHRFAEYPGDARQFLLNHGVDAGILQSHGIYHPFGTLRDARRRVPEPGLLRSALEGKGTEYVQVVKFGEFGPEAECAAGGYYGVVEPKPAQLHRQVRGARRRMSLFRVHHSSHMISSVVSTGPSLQIRLLPLRVRQLHPIHPPTPHPIRSSKLNCPGTRTAPDSARSIGMGPQAYT